jgi:hypothetical protein
VQKFLVCFLRKLFGKMSYFFSAGHAMGSKITYFFHGLALDCQIKPLHFRSPGHRTISRISSAIS